MSPDPFLPAAERIEVLRSYARHYRPRYFIETGTCHGDTPAALTGEFDRLFTIELSSAFFAAAQRRFEGTNVTCLHGDSAQILPAVLAELDGPALIWLDGHWSGGNTARGSIDTPVVAELEAIFAAAHRHIVVVDDARLFGGMTHHTEEFADYPDVEWITKLAKRHDYVIEVRDDMIRLTP